MTIWTTKTEEGFRSIDSNNCTLFDIFAEFLMDANDVKKKKAKNGKK